MGHTCILYVEYFAEHTGLMRPAFLTLDLYREVLLSSSFCFFPKRTLTAMDTFASGTKW